MLIDGNITSYYIGVVPAQKPGQGVGNNRGLVMVYKMFNSITAAIKFFKKKGYEESGPELKGEAVMRNARGAWISIRETSLGPNQVIAVATEV